MKLQVWVDGDDLWWGKFKNNKNKFKCHEKGHPGEKKDLWSYKYKGQKKKKNTLG